MVTFIWDVDGTLVDSYPLIVNSAMKAAEVAGVKISEEEIHEQVIRESVTALLERLSRESGMSFATVKSTYSVYSRSRVDLIELMPGAEEVLKESCSHGVRNFIITHRGTSTFAILKNNGIEDYFTEVITSQSGFARKPEREALDYLVKKYTLDRSAVCYIGDRSLDMEFARNGEVKGILFDRSGITKPIGSEERIVEALTDLRTFYANDGTMPGRRINA